MTPLTLDDAITHYRTIATEALTHLQALTRAQRVLTRPEQRQRRSTPAAKGSTKGGAKGPRGTFERTPAMRRKMSRAAKAAWARRRQGA